MSTLTEQLSSSDATAAVNRRILPFVLLVTVFNYISRTNLEYAALELNAELRLDAAAYGTAAGLYFLGFGVFMLPSSFMSVRQRSSRSWWFGIITSAWGVISMLHCTIRKPAHLDVLRVALGAAQAGGTTSTWHIISQFYPSSRRGQPMAVYVLGQVCAMAIAPPISAAILQYLSAGQQGLSGWQWLYLIEGIPSVLLGFAMIAWLPVSPLSFNQLSKQQQQELHSEVHGTIEAAEAAKHPPTWNQLPSHVYKSLRTPALLYFSVLGFLWMFCMASLFYWLPLMVANILAETALTHPSIGDTVNSAHGSGNGSSNTDSMSSSSTAVAETASTQQQITAALLASTVPYVGAAAATVLVVWLASAKPSKTVSTSSSSGGDCGNGCNSHDNTSKSRRRWHSTSMLHVAGPLFVGAIPLLCFTPACLANPFAGFAMLCIALTAGFAANSTMVSEASKTVPASTAGIGLVVFNLAVALGGLVGPTAVGQIVQQTGGFQWAVVMVGSGMALAAAVAAARGVYELAGYGLRQAVPPPPPAAAAAGKLAQKCCQAATGQPGMDAKDTHIRVTHVESVRGVGQAQAAVAFEFQEASAGVLGTVIIRGAAS